MKGSLADWIDRQYRRSATAMLRGISAVDLLKKRPGFGQVVCAERGSVVASIVLADWDPEPDYFFHWFRDSAIVIDALRVLHQAGDLGIEARMHFGDFVRFSLALNRIDGRAMRAESAQRVARAQPGFRKFLRDDEELAGVHGEWVVADTRVNPDGTLDVSKWARPQYDGPPLRALALLRWINAGLVDSDVIGGATELLRADLDFTRRHWHESSFDIWEEERGHHYYTQRVSAAALELGARWCASQGDHERADDCAVQSRAALSGLDAYWLDEAGHYRSRVLPDPLRSAKDLDMAVVFSAIHSGATSGPHSVLDPCMQRTLARLEALFSSLYAINRKRAAGPAMGRYEGDVYHSGGAYYFSTLAAAEFCYRVAAAGNADAPRWREEGDAFLATVCEFTPDDGALSEQFDQSTGVQTSARHLTWSYAAFVTAVAARRSAVSG
ncbi:MAG: Glucan 1,4-alpha-glucosidase [Panacagrimonas sp.]|nr:glycoside hydrolase family 15 protein [Panacagrimonas sp.]MCC2659067.1 Glucan 1,4-alpha-glucosidase [Panacagrimonas sp.]